jgi:hypothetical protein
MVRAKILGIDGEVWIERGKLEAVAGPIRHPPFCAQAREVLSSIYDILKDVNPIPLERWEEGFRRDAHPEQAWDLRRAGRARGPLPGPRLPTSPGSLPPQPSLGPVFWEAGVGFRLSHVHIEQSTRDIP